LTISDGTGSDPADPDLLAQLFDAEGLLVTHFFYIRFLDRRTVLVTGLTRTGPS